MKTPVPDLLEDTGTEARLLRSEASLFEAQEIARLGSFSFEPKANRLEWSEPSLRIFGIPRSGAESTFEAYLACVHPDDREFVRRSTTPPLRDQSIAFRHRIVKPDGESCTIHFRARVVAGTAESPDTIIGTVQDISDKVQSEEIIRRLSHQKEMILNQTAQAIIGLDARGAVTFANPAAVRTTGWSIEELLAAPDIHDLIHQQSLDGRPSSHDGSCPLFQCLADGKRSAGEETFWRKSGQSFPARFSCAPIIESSGLTGAVWIFDDLTEQKRLESALEQANRVSDLGRVAATIAHEFNNVLMGIQPFAEVIRRRSSDEKTIKAADQIASSVIRGKRVTQEILRFTQSAEPAMQHIVVNDWLQHLLPELLGLIGARVEIDLHMPARFLAVKGDPAQLQQVLTNLVLNARDAMGGKGSIAIGIYDDASGRKFSFGIIPPGVVLITVHDSGSGMSPEVLGNIFEPLFTTKRTGTGLGLAVAKQVILRHGGSIHAESRLGEGTTFFILLPSASGRVPSAVAESERAKSRIHRVVLVDDEEAVATGIILLLEMEGVEVRLADRGAKALEVIRESQPDAVILDIGLPDMDGTEVYERIAAEYPLLPVLFSSGHGDESSVERYVRSPHVAFLRKPYEFSALMEALDEIAGEVRHVGADSSS